MISQLSKSNLGALHLHGIILAVAVKGWRGLWVVLMLMVLIIPWQNGYSQSTESNPPATPLSSVKELAHSWGIEPLYHADSGIRGSASCAASSCHSGPKPGTATATAARGSEYSLWFERDPHARSWRTLSSDRSAAILKKLGILEDGRIVNVPAYQNCLACHNTDRTLGSDGLSPKIMEGVGCESCHGPSSAWYDKHYKEPASKVGMTELGPFLKRARACTLCHVGASDRDMNHDIIAAGHPALYFDMAIYHENYPKHWREKGQPLGTEHRDTNERSQLWIAGQIAMADAELELTEARVCKSLSVSTWPELAAFRCTDCHLTLSGIPRSIANIDTSELRTGRVKNRDWNLGGIDAVAEFVGSADGAKIRTDRDELISLMQSNSFDTVAIAKSANGLRDGLIETLSTRPSLQLPQWTLKRQRQFALQLLERPQTSDQWESAARAYTAIWGTGEQRNSTELTRAMKTMRRALLFPQQSQSPRFPRSPNSVEPPNLAQWNESLKRATIHLLQRSP